MKASDVVWKSRLRVRIIPVIELREVRIRKMSWLGAMRGFCTVRASLLLKGTVPDIVGNDRDWHLPTFGLATFHVLFSFLLKVNLRR